MKVESEKSGGRRKIDQKARGNVSVDENNKEVNWNDIFKMKTPISSASFAGPSRSTVVY